MSAIDQKLRELKEQEEKLKLEQKKIEFLKHIEASVVSYKDKSFAEVKESVVLLVKDFVANTIKTIESSGTVPPKSSTQSAETPKADTSKSQEAAKPQAVPEMSPGEKMNFALDNRHLGGKKVQVINDKNLDIRGEVVGLDAPFVVVKTDVGHIIKVPLQNVSLA